MGTDSGRGASLKTAAAVVDALGRDAVYALGLSPQEVTNALARDRFSATTFVLFTEALAAKGLRVDPALWGMKSPRRAARTTSNRRRAHG